MKKRLLLLSVLALFLSSATNAYDFRVDGIYYNVLSPEDMTCEVTYLSTSNSNNSAYQGSIDIPNTVEYESATYTVISIGDSAFQSCTVMTEVTIPKSVTTIGKFAFYGCSGLASVTIPDSVTEIGAYAFRDCTRLANVTIGVGVTTIGNQAFRDCTGLTEVNFNATACTSVGSSSSGVFYGCSNIFTVNFGDNVTIIPNRLFYGCTMIKEITIPEGVISIGSEAFRECARLTSMSIPNSVTEIGSYAFYNCSGLISVTIGNGVTEIGNDAFDYCSGLTSVTIGNSVETISARAFKNCKVLKSIYSNNPEPPICGSEAFYNVPAKTCVLYVPDGSLGAYANADEWKDFYNIVEIEVDAIADILFNGNAEAVGYYTTDGKQVPQLQRGVNIVRYSDGTAKKVLVK